MSGADTTSLLARGSERLNPVFLKEVRAALRGRWFRSTFAIVLSLALIASLGFLMFTTGSGSESHGSAYFAIVTGCMALGVHGLVPFAAMLSMTAESDEHTLELLQLSGLAGWRIVLGKLGSALLQMLLIMSAFAPFLTVAFLLRGVAFSTVVMTLVSSALVCAAECSVGLMLGSLVRARWARIVLLLVFAFFLLQFSQMGFFFLFMGAMRMGGPVAGGAMSVMNAAFVLVCLTMVCVSTAIAAGRLGHPEDNQSTPMRVTTTLMVLAGIGYAAFADTVDTATVTLCVTVLFVGPLMFILATERERLPRAVAAHMPRWGRVFPLQAWLPGGGRGAWFVLLHAFAILAAFELICRLRLAHGFVWDRNFMILSGVLMNVLVFLLLPSAIFASTTDRPGGRAVARVLAVTFFAGANLAPIFLSFLTQDSKVRDWVPLAAPFQVDSSGHYLAPWILLCVLAVAAVLASIPRLVRSLREVSAAVTRPARAPEVHAEAVT